MKHLKLVSVLLSAAITASMIVAPAGVIADEVPETSETEIVETEKETDPKESEKKEPAETKAPEASSETGVETTKEEEETEPSEETKPSESVPSEAEEKVPEETVPSESEPVSSEPVPESEDKKPARNEEVPVSGKCGKSLTWEIQDKDQYGCYLYIDGSGDMYNYSAADQTPWYQYGTRIKYLTISDDVTSIGNYAFSGTGVWSFSAPSKLKKIGDHAFDNCKSLGSVDLDSVLVSIGTYAFNNCSSITQIEIPKTVTNVGSYAFAGLSKIKEIMIPGGVKTVADNSFANCSSLEKVSFFKGVTTIDCAFAGCTKINNLIIPTTVTKIKESAFADLAGFPDVYYGGSVEQWKKIVIGNNNDKLTGASMHWSSGIASGTLGSNLTWTLDDNGRLTISGSGKMTDELKYGWYPFRDYITSIVIEDKITYISIAAFDSCKALKSVTIPEGVTTIETAAFINCTSLTGITIPKSVKTIKNEAFEGCKALKNVVIPGSVTTLGDSAFKDCTNLKTVDIPKSVKYLADTFDGCTSLTTINYAGTEEEWKKINDGEGGGSFPGVTVVFERAMHTITVLPVKNGTITLSKYEGYLNDEIKITAVPDKGYYYAGYRFNGAGNTYRGTTIYMLNKDITLEFCFSEITEQQIGTSFAQLPFWYEITNNATDGTGTVKCTGLALVLIPDEATAFQLFGNTVMPSTVTEDGVTYKVTSIAPDAFRGVKYFKSFTIGAYVTVIGNNAFYGCANLTKVSGGARLKTIGSNAFARCPKLSSFKISSKVLSKIGTYAFNKDSKLKTVYIKSTTKLSKKGVKKSLKGSKVKTVKVKKSKVRKYKKYFTKKNCGRKVKVKK